MLLLSDVTETVHNEEALLYKSRQLAELNTFKDKMFNVVAHEMGHQIQNTFTLVESLLEWFQSQRGGMVFNLVIRDLAHTVQTNVRLLQVRCAGKNINIISEISDSFYVFADKEMLDLFIRNLLSNAIKFTEYGGSIRLKAVQTHGKIIVSVSDTGSGIPADQAETILEEAYPVSSLGTAGERGVGLGLPYVRNLFA